MNYNDQENYNYLELLPLIGTTIFDQLCSDYKNGCIKTIQWIRRLLRLQDLERLRCRNYDAEWSPCVSTRLRRRS